MKEVAKSDGPKHCQADCNKSVREAETSYDISYMQNLDRQDTNEIGHNSET